MQMIYNWVKWEMVNVNIVLYMNEVADVNVICQYLQMLVNVIA